MQICLIKKLAGSLADNYSVKPTGFSTVTNLQLVDIKQYLGASSLELNLDSKEMDTK